MEVIAFISLFVFLAVIYAAVIAIMPPVVKTSILLWRVEVVTAPHVAAWGIGCTITGAKLFGFVPSWLYWVLVAVFWFMYPIIIAGYQAQHKKYKNKELPLLILFVANRDSNNDR